MSEREVVMQTLVDRAMFDKEDFRNCNSLCQTDIDHQVRMEKTVFVKKHPKVSFIVLIYICRFVDL